MFSIDVRSREPIYEQLIKNIINLVTNGILLSDEPLPSVRALARDLGINPNTVQKAYRELEAKGIIYHAAGRGSFIAPSGELLDAVHSQHLDSIAAAAAEAVKAGVPQESVIGLINKLYGGAKKK